MNDDGSFQRLAAWAAILSAPLAFGNVVLGSAAVDYNLGASSDPTLILSIGAEGANLWRWSMVLDMLGFYLLLVPAALLLWSWLKPKGTNLVGLYTFCGLAYILLGALGATIIAAISPSLMTAYAQAPAQQREVLVTVFTGFWNAVYGGIWTMLETILAGIWWLGIGSFLRSERGLLGIFTMVVGGFALFGAGGSILNVEAIRLIGVAGLILAPIWALWLGIDLLHRPVLSTQSA